MEGGIKQREEKEREMKQTLPPLHRKRLVIPILFGALHVHICIHPGLGHHAWPSHRFSDLLRQIDLPKAKEEEQRLWLPEPWSRRSTFFFCFCSCPLAFLQNCSLHYISLNNQIRKRKETGAQKETQEDSFIPSQHKNKLQNQNKKRNKLILKGSTKIHSIRQTRIDDHIHKWFTNHLLLVP